MRKPLTTKPRRGKVGKGRRGAGDGSPASALGPDMKTWTDRQVQSALYSQLFLIRDSLSRLSHAVEEALKANAHGGMNASRHPMTPCEDEERKTHQHSHTEPTNAAQETFNEWLARHKEIDEILDPVLDQGISKGPTTRKSVSIKE